jgi:hypothetical protein
MLQQNIGGFLQRIAGAIQNIDIDNFVKGFITFVKWGIRFAKLAFMWTIAINALSAASMVIQVLGAVGIGVGAGMTAAWAPFLVIALAIVAAIGLIWWGLSRLTGLPGLDELTGLGDFTSEFNAANPDLTEPVSLEGRNAVSAADQTISRNNTQISRVELGLPEGVTATPVGSAPEGVTFAGLDLGNQLGGAYA